MKKPSAGTVFVAVGLFLFLLGLMLLVHQSYVGFLSQLFSDAESSELFGVALQFLGGLLVVYGTIISFADRFVASYRKESQQLLVSLAAMMERVEKRTAESIDRFVSAQKMSGTPQGSMAASSLCKYCGAELKQESNFCSNCGRSQK